MVEPEIALDNIQNADEGFVTYYVADEWDGGDCCSVVTDAPDYDMDGTRALNFFILDKESAPIDEPSGINISRRETDHGTTVEEYSTGTAVLAAGIYLTHLEIHGIEEDAAWDFLKEEIGQRWVTEVRQELDGLSRKERAQMMMAQVEGKANESPTYIWTKPIDEGRWRDTSLSSEAVALARTVLESIETDPRTCYLTAQRAYREAGDNDRVSYCEGLAFPKHTGRVVKHAWIEIDGSVAELTWPWHRVDAADALYYGVSIPDKLFQRRLRTRGKAPTLLLDDDERETMMKRISKQNRLLHSQN